MLVSKHFFNTSYTKREIEAIIILLLLSFFMGVALTFFFTVSISSFLVSFSTEKLPYAYLLAGILSFVIWTAHRYLIERIQFSTLVILTLCFLFFSVSLLALANSFYKSMLLSLLLLAWVSPFLFVKNICFWGLASKVFNLSQGKKVFGIISSGEVISNIMAFFSIPFLLSLLNATGLLIISIASILICIALVLLLIHKYGSNFKSYSITSKDAPEKKIERVPAKDNFFLITLIFSSFSVFVFYFIDYMFLDLARNQFSSIELLAAFMGYFLGAVSLVELFFKSIIFNRILTHYGLKVGLLCLSVTLLFSTLLSMFAKTWIGESYIYFSIIALSKLLERSLNNGIHAPSLQLIYQPLPASIRTVFQSNVEGISGAVGNLLAGGVLLLLSAIHISNFLPFNYILLVVLSLWIMVTIPLYKSYKLKLQEALLLKKNFPSTRKIMSSIDILKKGLQSKNENVATTSAKLLKVIESKPNLKIKDVSHAEIIDEETLLKWELRSISGDKEVLNNFENLFARSSTGGIRLKVLELYFRIGTEASKSLLLNKLKYPDREIQLSTTRILYSLNYTASGKEHSLIKGEIIETISMITWLSACLLDLDKAKHIDTCNKLIKSLRIERKEYFDILYMLLSFVYGYATVELIKANLIDKNDTESHIYALEVAANTFDQDIVTLIAPWFDNVTLDKSIERLKLFFPQQQLSIMDRAVNILYRDYSSVTLWTKLNALNVLADFYANEDARNEIIACLFHKEQLIHEMAWAILQHHTAGLSIPNFLPQIKLSKVNAVDTKTIYEKVQLLKNVPLFHVAPEYKLILLASVFNFKMVQKGSKEHCKESVIIISGSLTFYKGSHLHVKAQAFYTFIPGIHPTSNTDYYVVEEDSTILIADKEKVLDCFFEDPNLSKSLLKYASENNRRQVNSVMA